MFCTAKTIIVSIPEHKFCMGTQSQSKLYKGLLRTLSLKWVESIISTVFHTLLHTSER